MSELDEREVRVEVFTNASPIVRMRLLHLPTGYSVDGESESRVRLKAALMKALAEVLGQINKNDPGVDIDAIHKR